MTVLSAQTIRRLALVDPCLPAHRHDETGATGGLSCCGYDVHLAQDIVLWGGRFLLASVSERFTIPNDIVGIVHDKSSWARRGLAVQNTVIEPGWRGYLTLELTHHGNNKLVMPAGTPIAQVVFHYLDEPTEQPYRGKYQDQESGPQGAR